MFIALSRRLLSLLLQNNFLPFSFMNWFLAAAILCYLLNYCFNCFTNILMLPFSNLLNCVIRSWCVFFPDHFSGLLMIIELTWCRNVSWPFQKEFRDDKKSFKRNVARCVRKSQEELCWCFCNILFIHLFELNIYCVKYFLNWLR